MPIRYNYSDPMPSLGSKHQVIDKICEVAEFAISSFSINGVQELFGGGFRFNLYLDSPRALEIRTGVEVDLGVVQLFRCLQDPYKTDLLIREICLIESDYSDEKDFDTANVKRLQENTNQIEAAALTYIVVMFSRAADRQVFIQDQANKGIKPKSLNKFYDLHLTISDVQFYCDDYLHFLRKYRERKDILLYLDPPYISTELSKTGKAITAPTAGYINKFTESDHIKMVEELKVTKNKFILSGYENELYKSLENDKNGFFKTYIGAVKISSGKERKEYIWTNFEVPEHVWG